VDAALVALLAEATAAAARGDVNLAASYVERARGHLGQPTLPGMPGPAPEAPPASAAQKEVAVRLFAYWQVKTDHRSAKPSPERIRAVVSRLRDGYSESEIRKAIDGAAAAPYVNQESGHRYDDLTLICRNGSKLEDFIARGVAATGAVVLAPAESSTGGIEEQIANLRRSMATMHKDGRQAEYTEAEAELRRLMQTRKR
jgi:hypothetical protein